MSNVQRVAGSLFAKLRDVRTGLRVAQRDVTHVIWFMDNMTRELESVTRALDNERQCYKMCLVLSVCMNIALYSFAVYMLGHQLGCRSTRYILINGNMTNMTKDHHFDVVMDRTGLRMYAEELFAWLLVHPWVN
jgi:hypothetical protein